MAKNKKVVLCVRMFERCAQCCKCKEVAKKAWQRNEPGVRESLSSWAEHVAFQRWPIFGVGEYCITFQVPH